MSPDKKCVLALGTALTAGLVLWMLYKHLKMVKRAVVKSLFVYPVKSCAGINLDKVDITELGFLLDRSWVLCNAQGVVQTMRQLPKMALIKPSVEETDYLVLDAPGMPTMKIPIDIEEDSTEKQILDLFGLHGEGLDCGDDVAQWFDRFLGKEGHRLFTSRSSCLKRRELKEDDVWGDSVQSTDRMMFQDSAPIMLVSKASLEAVNKKLDCPVDIRTFRPNIYVEGCLPYEEDFWQSVQIGKVLLRKLRQTPRCVLTTVDMDLGIKRKDGEPLKTLRRIRVSKTDDRRYNGKPLFGDLFTADVPGTIHVGDDVKVLA